MTATIDDDLVGTPRATRSAQRPQDACRVRARFEQRQLATVKRALEDLVDTFEVNRMDQVVERGAPVTAAYDTGISSAVQEALDELDAGCYGFCITCRARIPFSRLSEVPYARRCATCQRQEEAGWNEVEHLFAGFIRQWVGEPQGPIPTSSNHSGS